MKGLKLRYKGNDALSTQKINHIVYGKLHKVKGNCMNYTPGILHAVEYVKLYNGCYFIPDQVFHIQSGLGSSPTPMEDLEKNIRESIGTLCFDLLIEKFELPEDEHFKKYIFKNGFNYWKDYTRDLGRVFKCKGKFNLELV